MACHSRGGEFGGGGSVALAPAASADAPQSTTKLHCSDSAAEWRSRDQLEPSPPSTSPAYWDSDEEDDSSNSSSIVGPKPSELYGKFTWKIENFSEISKRELRSNVFEVGGYKWYILVYPQGCDVCNHLSLFLCVADYDKLLPGWSHFAQFTIAVVNKDPKKSKYSDTLHRFCKKEHDWGWKKFMELSKVLDGFTVADTLVIKAQVQVIRENPHRPFRCLDCQYRRELVRVYLTNVEGICRRFVEEKREKLGKLMEDTPRWASFRTFWSAVEEGARYRLAREKTDVILKAVVKRFFNEKEVTSTLVMDALYSGCKALDYRTRNKKGKINGVDVDEGVSPVVWVDKDAFVLAGDVLTLLERAVGESLPPYKDDKGPQNRTKDVGSGDDFGKDSVERDERRLTELGRRTVEMFVLAHLYTNRVEVAYREAVALKRQEELIREEEAAGQAETELRIKREAAEKEKRSKKKQAKQRRKDRKEKDKEAEEKKLRVEQEQRSSQRQGHGHGHGHHPSSNSCSSRQSKESAHKERELSPLVSTEAGEDEEEISALDLMEDAIVGTLGPAVEDGDTDRTSSWEREAALYAAQNGSMEASFSGAVTGLEDSVTTPRNSRISSRKQQAASALDDSSSTCSSDSFPSIRNTINESFVPRPTSLPEQNHSNPSRERSGEESEVYDTDGQYIESDGMLRPSGLDANGTGEPSSSTSSVGVDSDTVILSLTERVRWLEQRLLEKEEEVVLLQEQLSLFEHQVGVSRSARTFGGVDETAAAGGLVGRGVVRSSSSISISSRDAMVASSILEEGQAPTAPLAARGDASSFPHFSGGGPGGDVSDSDKGATKMARLNGGSLGHGLSNGNVETAATVTRSGPVSSAAATGNENRSSSGGSGYPQQQQQQGPSKHDPIRSSHAPSRSRSVDFSRPPRLVTPPGATGLSMSSSSAPPGHFGVAAAGAGGATAGTVEETSLAHHPLPSSSAAAGAGAAQIGIGLSISRPSTAPGLGAGGSSRPSIPVASSSSSSSSSSSPLHSSQPLARSMSVGAGGRQGPATPGTTAEAAAVVSSHHHHHYHPHHPPPHANGIGMAAQSPPVTPSYKNATIGKTRSSAGGAGHVAHPVSSGYSNYNTSAMMAGPPGMSGVPLSASSYMTSSSSSLLQPISQSMAAPAPAPVPLSGPLSSPPMTPSPKMHAMPGQQAANLVGNSSSTSTTITKGEGPSSSVGFPSVSSPVPVSAPGPTSLTLAPGPDLGSLNQQQPLLTREGSAGSTSGGHSSMGITFGTVTPELLQDDQLDLPLQLDHTHSHLQPQLQQHDESSGQQQHQQTEQSKDPQLRQQQQGGAQIQNLVRPKSSPSSAHHHKQQHQLGSSSQGLLAAVDTTMNDGTVGLAASMRRATPPLPAAAVAVLGSSSMMSNGNVTLSSEEFPHLDIINDLLDEDQHSGGGMGLKSVMLQQHHHHLHHPSSGTITSSGGVGYSRSMSLGGAGHKLSYGQQPQPQLPQQQQHSGDRGGDGSGDRSRGMAENGDERSSGGNNNSSGGLAVGGESVRMATAPFQHPPLARLHSQHNGVVLDGVTSHYWPTTIGSSSSSSSAMPIANNNGGIVGGPGAVGVGVGGGNVSTGRNGLVDSHLASFSLVQGHHLNHHLNHIGVPDCSGFALGHSGYTVFAPTQP